MPLIEKLTEIVMKALAGMSNVTFATIAKCTLITLLLAVGYVFWEHREPVYKTYIAAGRVSTGKIPMPLSEESVAAVKKLADMNTVIGGIQVINANFQTNERVVVFTYADARGVKTVIDEYYKHKISPAPLFLDKDAVGSLDNNTRMISIINGQYICQPFDKTLAFQVFPIEARISIADICSISIPPYFGYFSGYIALYLIRHPTDKEAEEIRSAVRALSSDIYDREFLK